MKKPTVNCSIELINKPATSDGKIVRPICQWPNGIADINSYAHLEKG